MTLILILAILCCIAIVCCAFIYHKCKHKHKKTKEEEKRKERDIIREQITMDVTENVTDNITKSVAEAVAKTTKEVLLESIHGSYMSSGSRQPPLHTGQSQPGSIDTTPAMSPNLHPNRGRFTSNSKSNRYTSSNGHNGHNGKLVQTHPSFSPQHLSPNYGAHPPPMHCISPPPKKGSVDTHSEIYDDARNIGNKSITYNKSPVPSGDMVSPHMHNTYRDSNEQSSRIMSGSNHHGHIKEQMAYMIYNGDEDGQTDNDVPSIPPQNPRQLQQEQRQSFEPVSHQRRKSKSHSKHDMNQQMLQQQQQLHIDNYNSLPSGTTQQGHDYQVVNRYTMESNNYSGYEHKYADNASVNYADADIDEKEHQSRAASRKVSSGTEAYSINKKYGINQPDIFPDDEEGLL